MDLRVLLLLLGFGCLLLEPIAGSADELNSAANMQLGTKAKPIQRNAPRYPHRELDNGQQGWVELSYVVTKEGTVIDPVVEASSGSRHFERVAMRTVQGWSYEPATWKGEPVQQCKTEVRLIFAMDGHGTGVNRKYYQRHRRIEKAIESGDTAKAQEMIDALRDRYSLSISETSWLWTLQARLHGLSGDKQRQLSAIRKATRSETWVDEDLYPNLLLVKTALELELQQYSSALESHGQLTELDKVPAQASALEPYVENLREKVAGDDVLMVKGKVTEKGNWHYRPLRQSVSLSNVAGDLETIEFRCTWHRAADEARVDFAWEIPEEWGRCSILVFGKPGAQFELLEIPNPDAPEQLTAVQ